MHVDADVVVARIEADGVVGGGEHHALDALAARRLEQIVAADDVGLQDRLPRPFDREAAEMDDAFDALDGLLDLVELGEVGGDERLVVAEIGRRLDVAQPQLGIDRLQQLAQASADVAGGAGQQNTFHACPPRLIARRSCAAAQPLRNWRSASRR